MANVRVIPPREMKPETLRVAAYCRVSSDSADQKHSYATQIRAYTEEISKHDGWEMVDVYADEGLTGTRLDRREDFHRMLADCRKGKIDRILVKSISRFARNTKDCLTVLRELSALGVTVYFEKENIDTNKLTTELMVSLFGALSQEESVSIGKNQQLSYQRRMERGEFITCKAPLGYRLVDGKNLKIAEDEAKVVRWIFDAYLDGHSAEWITAKLNKHKIPAPCGESIWHHQAIPRILSNEKYVGDSLCQKKYTTDTFPFVRKWNHGERDQYYTERTHPAIISTETFEKARLLRERRAQREARPKAEYPLAMKIVCGNCGSPFTRRMTKSGLVSWVCRKHDDRAADCPMPRIPEQEIYAAFVRMYNKLKRNEGIVLKPALAQLDDLNAALQRGNPAMLEVNRAIADTSEQSYNITLLQNRGLLDADACAAKLQAIHVKLAQLRRERRRLLQNEDLEDVMEALRRTADTVHTGPERLDGFDEGLFAGLVEKITVESQTSVRFHLGGGIELREQLREVSR
jgi:site-specific DNA recombinase